MDVNVQNEDEGFDTALMRAAGQGHLAVVRFLVEQGADLYLRNKPRYEVPEEITDPRVRNPVMEPWTWSRAPSSCKAPRRPMHSIR